MGPALLRALVCPPARSRKLREVTDCSASRTRQRGSGGAFSDPHPVSRRGFRLNLLVGGGASAQGLDGGFLVGTGCRVGWGVGRPELQVRLRVQGSGWRLPDWAGPLGAQSGPSVGAGEQP